MSTRASQLRQENAQLRDRIALLKTQSVNSDLQTEINRFVEESKRNLNDMNRKIVEENSRQNALLHTVTANYEATLKRQIELLSENKKLSQQKEQQDAIFNQAVEKLTIEYQNQIKTFQNKVKANVKRIQDISNGGNMITRLIANPRFRQVMQQRGCSLQALENQCKLEEVSQELEEREKEIQEAEDKSTKLDEELTKMHELIGTMKSLLENMMKEKENILRQNVVLKEKLKQSQALIAKLLGQEGQEGVQQAVQEEEQQDEAEGQQSG